MGVDLSTHSSLGDSVGNLWAILQNPHRHDLLHLLLLEPIDLAQAETHRPGAVAPAGLERRIPIAYARIRLAHLDTMLALTAAADLPLAVGVNIGPVLAELNDRGDAVLAGDGIETAMVIAGFAAPGQILVSRSVRDGVLEQAPERGEDLRSMGTFTDARVRTHELFAPDEHAALRRRRRLFTLGAASFCGILAIGFAARQSRERALIVAGTPAGKR